MTLFSFGRKKQGTRRYEGKPFLKLVDSFVLKSIGELDSSQETLLVQLTPRLQTTFGCSGTWEEIVISQLAFPPDIGEKIKVLWGREQTIAEQNDAILSPMQFVEMFVNSNVSQDMKMSAMPETYDTYSVATLREGKTTYYVDFQPCSPHGGPISMWQREDNGNSCGRATTAEEVKANAFLMKVLDQCKSTWLLEVCCNRSPSEMTERFLLEFYRHNARKPEKTQ